MKNSKERLKELEDAYSHLGEEIRKLKEAPPETLTDVLWKPGRGGEYFLCYGIGQVGRFKNTVDAQSNDTLAVGNMHRSRELAEKHAKRLKVFNLMWRLAEELNGDWKPDYCRAQNSSGGMPAPAGAAVKVGFDGEVRVGGVHTRDYGIPLYRTEEIAQRVIDLIGADVIKDAWS